MVVLVAMVAVVVEPVEVGEEGIVPAAEAAASLDQ